MIRIPDTPGLQGTTINAPDARQADQRLGPALAVNAAMGGPVADAIGNVGEGFQNIADRAQKMENFRQESDAKMKLDSAYAQLQIDLEKDPDPVSRIEKTKQFFEANRGISDDPNLSPQVRDSLRMHYADFAHKGTIHATASAAKLTQQKAHYAMANEVDAAVKAGDEAGAYGAIDRAVAAGVRIPEQAVADKLKVKDAIRLQNDQKDIIADPAGWLEDNPPDKPKEGYDPVQWQQQQAFAKRQLRARTYDATTQIQDGIASGQITKPGQIDFLAPDLRPAAREELKQALAAKNSDEAKQAAASPEYQQQVVGQVSKMLSDYNPESDTCDRDFVKMDALVRTLPPGAVRDELERNIRDVREEKTREVKTHAEAGDKALDAAREMFFPKTAPVDVMPTLRAINDGFLRNAAKLEALGFSKDQAAAIVGGADTTDKQRADAFKLGWTQRTNPGADPDPVAAATARAILNEESKITLTNPEQEDAMISARIQGEIRYGKAKTEYAEWKKLNPDATNQEVEEKIRSLAGESARQKLSSGIYDAKPTRSGPQGADDSTSAVPAGKDLTEIVKNFEASGGFHKEAYWDYGQWSIGYGTKSKEGEVIDQKEADARLAKELGMHRGRVEAAASKLGLKFTPAQLDALTSFDFNTGKIETLLAGGTRSNQQIADTMLLYRNADGQRLRGLENRRKAERHLFLYGHAGESRDTSTAKNEGELSPYNVIQ